MVEALDAVLDTTPLRLRDAILAEIDLINDLTDWAGQKAVEDICRARGVDIEGCAGAHDRAAMLALDERDAFQSILFEAGFRRRSGGKHWSSFRLSGGGEIGALDDEGARERFVAQVLETLETDRGRRYDSDWYDAIRRDGDSERRTYQATIYVEQQREGELLFGKDGIEFVSIQRVGEIGVCYDPKEGCLEVCAPGMKKQHEEFARTFAEQFLESGAEVAPVPWREVDFERLRRPQAFVTEDADRIERVEVSELVFKAREGRKAAFEKRGVGESIYEYLAAAFKERSPLRVSEWDLDGATIRVTRRPAGGKGRSKTTVVDLRSPNRTNIRNRTDEESDLINTLFERWKIYLPEEEDEPLIEREPRAMAS